MYKMMTTFGWKRKRKLQGTSAATFAEDIADDGGEAELDREGVDWLNATKRRKTVMLEDAQTKSKRLREEGTLLAENERYWEAIKHWDEALQLTPDSAPLHEMKSQALLELKELYEAVFAAEKAVELDPTWAVARQTLGRAQLGIGELEMALQSFQKAVHLDPTNDEVRLEDLKWTHELLKKKTELKDDLRSEEEAERNDILFKRNIDEEQS